MSWNSIPLVTTSGQAFQLRFTSDHQCIRQIPLFANGKLVAGLLEEG